MQPLTKSKSRTRERERETTEGLSAVAIRESAHAIPPRRRGQSAGSGQRSAMGVARILLCSSSIVTRVAASEVNRLMYSIRHGVLLYYRKGSGRAVRMEGVDRPKAGRFCVS